MDLFDKELFKQLAEVNNTVAVSLYLPLETEVDKHDKNRIRLKNQLAEATDTLKENYDFSTKEVTDLLEPASRLIANGRFTTDLELNDGLAIFLSAERSEIYTLPRQFEAQMFIGSHFYLTPLLPLLTENGRFYILALSQNEIRLLQASAHTIENVPLGDNIPASLTEALKWEDPEAQTQWHTNISSHARDSRQAVFHGHGGASDENEKEGIEEYFRQVATGIDTLLNGEDTPLVLAGVDYLLSIYEQVSSYPHLLKAGIAGTPEQLSASTLRKKAWEIVAPHFEQDYQREADRLKSAYHANSDLVTDDVENIITAAHYGQVEMLFLDEDGRYWGRFDAAQGAVTRQRADEPNSQELLERTAVQTILTGGTVYVVTNVHLPIQTTAVAQLRSPVYSAA